MASWFASCLLLADEVMEMNIQLLEVDTCSYDP
jgi:hypothetical protein